MDERQRRTRRRKEKLLTFSPGEWLWVIGTTLAYLAVGLTLFPEKTLIVAGAWAGFWLLYLLI